MKPRKGSRVIDVTLHIRVNRSMTMKQLEKELLWLIRNGGHHIEGTRLLRIYTFSNSGIDHDIEVEVSREA